jgi:Ca2+-binding EF-hand superfamily protein
MSHGDFCRVSPMLAAVKERGMICPKSRIDIRMITFVMLTVLAGPLTTHAQARGDFDTTDTNHDGRVSLQEFEAYATGRLMAANGPRAKRFKQLTPQEQQARLQQRFDQLDQAHKGYIDRNDWAGS